MKLKCDDVPEISEYMHLVESGELETCAEQKKLMQLVRNAFETEELTVNREQLDQYKAYQQFFFKLHPWELFLLTLTLCTYRADGLPRWSQSFNLLGRGAGKSALGAFFSFCVLSAGNGIKEYDVDICANSEEQAKRIFNDVLSALRNYDDQLLMRKYWHWTKLDILNKTTNSTLKYRTSNTLSQDGLRSGMVIFDEVHAYKDWKNINVFTTGLGKKQSPRRFYFTTDGNIREGVIDNLKDRATNILDGKTEDNGFLPFICRLDDKNEVSDKAAWVKANPSLPYRPTLEAEIVQEYEDYKVDPVNCSDFITKRMNIPQGNAETEVATWEDILATKQELPDLGGMPCVAGIDFAKTNDFIGAVLLFRREQTYYAIHHSWACARSKFLGCIKAPLEEWERRGFLTMVDDVEVHPYLIVSWLYEQSKKYVIEKIGIDYYRHSFFMRELSEFGWSAKNDAVKLVRPSDVMLAQPKINSAFVNHRMVWGDEPMMRWYTNNTILEPAAHGNYTYGKVEYRSRKTDGFMALVSAMAVEEYIPEIIQYEFYEPVSL